VEFRQTRHQVARGTRPDGETHNKFVIIKNVSEMQATYQVRLLAYQASQEGKKLVIDVPKECKIHSTLRELMNQLPRTIQITRS
jgi:hypothetical protein